MGAAEDDALSGLGGDQPVPYLSDRSVEFIVDTIVSDDFPVLVEFGSGGSSRFFLRHLLDQGRKCCFVSVETAERWYRRVIEAIRMDLSGRSTSEETLDVRPWTIKRIRAYLAGESQTSLDVPAPLRRLESAKKVLRGGRFGLLRKRLWPRARPRDATYSVLIDGTVRFLYELRTEFVKDQYGESPFKQECIDAGLAPVRRALSDGTNVVRAAFLIDGGPRGDIVHAILDLEDAYPNFLPSIFLFEAQRLFYEPAISRRQSGQFIAGTNRMLNGEIVYSVDPKREDPKAIYWFGKKGMTADEMSAKEVWYYAADRAVRSSAVNSAAESASRP
jgi:hypothetical protein